MQTKGIRHMHIKGITRDVPKFKYERITKSMEENKRRRIEITKFGIENGDITIEKKYNKDC